jgi:hypothetical protein
MYLYFHLCSRYIKINVYFLVKFHVIVTTDMHLNLKNFMTHVGSLSEVLNSFWCSEMEHNSRNLLITPSSLHTHTHTHARATIGYCDISLWPITALPTSLITDVSYCFVGRSNSSISRSGLCGWLYCVTRGVCSSEHRLKNRYLVQAMKSSLQQLYHRKQCC